MAARQISISGITPGNRTLAVGIRLTPIIARVAKLRVKVATDGSELTAEDVVRRIAPECAYVDERGGVGIRLEPAVRRAIPPAAAATAPAAAGETASPALSGSQRPFFLHLTFATRKAAPSTRPLKVAEDGFWKITGPGPRFTIHPTSWVADVSGIMQQTHLISDSG